MMPSISSISKKGSALLISMFVTVIIILVAIYLLEKIVPFSRDIKGVENGNISYYRANTALNEALFTMSGADPGFGGSSGSVNNGSGRVYTITARGQALPMTGLGNSEYDANWSIIGPGKPIQLVLSNGIAWASTNFTFRVPDLNKDGDWLETLSGAATTPIINWSLSASGETLLASGTYSTTGVFLGGSYVMATDIFSGSSINFGVKSGLTLSGSNMLFSDFYGTPGNRCNGSEKCTLKLSLVNPLILNTGDKTPYLEYQARFNAAIPLQTAVIESQGFAGGFKKNITRFVQQLTTNEALDFTVFQ